jgi:NO-binding membrane sensor protein with MHYT domain
MKKGWQIAIGLALVGALLALTNTYLQYQRTGDIAYGKIALAIGVPAMFYAMMRTTRKSG